MTDITELKITVDGHSKDIVSIDKRIERLTTLFESAVERQKDTAGDIKNTVATIQKLDEKFTILVNLDKDVKHINERLNEVKENGRVTKHDVGNLQQAVSLIPSHHDTLTQHKTVIAQHTAQIAALEKRNIEQDGAGKVVKFLWATFGIMILGFIGWGITRYVEANFIKPQQVNVNVSGERQ